MNTLIIVIEVRISNEQRMEHINRLAIVASHQSQLGPYRDYRQFTDCITDNDITYTKPHDRLRPVSACAHNITLQSRLA